VVLQGEQGNLGTGQRGKERKEAAGSMPWSPGLRKKHISDMDRHRVLVVGGDEGELAAGGELREAVVGGITDKLPIPTNTEGLTLEMWKGLHKCCQYKLEFETISGFKFLTIQTPEFVASQYQF
jgi:hypothetical protein